MDIDRRNLLLSGLGTVGGLFAPRAVRAAPVLSETNYGRTHAEVVRSNAWLEIDAVAFEKNIYELRKLVGPERKMCLVVKGDAYGNGLSLLMPTIIRCGASCLGLASNEEARIVRALRFRGRLIRLRTATLGEVEDGFDYTIEELIGGLAYGAELSKIAARKGR